VFAHRNLQRRYFELCALTKLRQDLRSGDIWVDESQNFRKLSDFLLPEDTWQEMLAAEAVPLAVPLDAVTYLRQRHEALHEQLSFVDEGLANQHFPQVEMQKDRLKIARISLDIPADMKPIRDAVYALLPRIRITDLLLEVDASVHFSRHFTHSQTQEALDHPLDLFTTILADAINLGIEKMSLSTPNSRYERLAERLVSSGRDFRQNPSGTDALPVEESLCLALGLWQPFFLGQSVFSRGQSPIFGSPPQSLLWGRGGHCLLHPCF
jgi:hypothetical protein